MNSVREAEERSIKVLQKKEIHNELLLIIIAENAETAAKCIYL